MMKTTLYYIHDPMCSWCWAFSFYCEEFIEQLNGQVKVVRLLGGLAPDSDKPMSEETRDMVQSAWHKIEQIIPNLKFNYNYWKVNIPRRSTYPACRAVIAARQQGEQFDLLMTRAIQAAYYQHAQNPSDFSTLLKLAINLGLDGDVFTQDMHSQTIQDILLSEIKQVRSMGVKSFPTILLEKNKSIDFISINYLDKHAMLKAISQKIKS